MLLIIYSTWHVAIIYSIVLYAKVPYTKDTPNNHFLFNIFAFGGGVWGGVALKGKGNV